MNIKKYPTYLSNNEIEMLLKITDGSVVNIMGLGEAKVTDYNEVLGSLEVLFPNGQSTIVMPVQILDVINKAKPETNEFQAEVTDAPITPKVVYKGPTIGQIKLIALEMLRITPANGDWNEWMNLAVNLQHKIATAWEASDYIDWLRAQTKPLLEKDLLAHKKYKARAWYKLQEQGKNENEASELLKGALTRGQVRELIGESDRQSSEAA